MIRRFQSNSQLGMVQPLICFLHEKDQIWSAGGKWNSFLGRAITLGDREFLSNSNVADRPLDWATGCCMLVTREALLKVGLLNEGYFAYFEDVEWSLRFLENGYGIALASKAKIYHEAGASSKKAFGRYVECASVLSACKKPVIPTKKCLFWIGETFCFCLSYK
ncbi:hypothetical protein V8V91_14125 [Algoriphagus halophilus]|uniref:glycosyltransferase family 2 protein n=1 Tax=Algoriphagus halophilus TaxID=226505 RepID=UPI00358E2BD4